MKKTISILFLLALVFSSCGLPKGSNPPRPTPTFTISSTPTRSPTNTPSPSPIPASTPIPSVRLRQAEQAQFNGDYNQALELNRQALSTSIDSEIQAAALVGLAKIYYQTKNYTAALESLRRVNTEFASSSSRANALFLIAQCLVATKNPTQAVDAYTGFLNLRPEGLNDFVLELRGDAQFDSGDFAGAVSSYSAAIKATASQNVEDLDTKIGRSYSAMHDYTNAVRKFMAVYQSTNNDYTKAAMNLLAGQAYLSLGLPEQAFARFQDSIANFPRAYDSYSALVALVNANVQVNELDRGVVDYYARQYGLAADAFNRYTKSILDHNGTAHYYKALSLRAMGQYEAELTEWNLLIKDHPADRFWVSAWDEKAYTQWLFLKQYNPAIQTLLDFVSRVPNAPSAPLFLIEAARVMEMNNRLPDAATTLEKAMNDYPSSPESSGALFKAGVIYFRLANFTKANTIFQRCLLLSSVPVEQSKAFLWIGKIQLAQGDPSAAKSSWNQAAQRDPAGYYGIRAVDLIKDRAPFSASNNLSLTYDLAKEKTAAADWLRTTFNLLPNVDLTSPGPLVSNTRFIRANVYWELGLYIEARAEFDALRKNIQNDPANSFRLLNHLVDISFYRTAVAITYQILNLAKLDSFSLLQTPAYFNHIRYGLFYKDQVLAAAQTEKLSPLVLFSMIQQESVFDAFALSSAGARGLLQIMPATGKEIASQMNWPPGFTENDLFRPIINIPMGVNYLARQYKYFGNELYTALAAYNGGPGNATIWRDSSSNDPDLFLEMVNLEETRNYIKYVSEHFYNYRLLYDLNP